MTSQIKAPLPIWASSMKKRKNEKVSPHNPGVPLGDLAKIPDNTVNAYANSESPMVLDHENQQEYDTGTHQDLENLEDVVS